MSQVTAAPAHGAPTIPVVPVGQLAPWALFVGILGTVVLFFIGVDQGAVSFIAGSAVHEWVHDARHLMGYPCH